MTKILDDAPPRVVLFYGLDAQAQARDLGDKIKRDGGEVTTDVAPPKSAPNTWPSLARMEQLLFSSSEIPVFLLSPELTAALQRNRAFSEAIYDAAARNRVMHLVVTDVASPIPPCFLSMFAVELDHFSLRKKQTPSRRATQRTDIRDIIQRKEPGRRATLMIPGIGANPNALGYEVIELVDPLNVQDRSYIAAFVSEPFSIAAASEDIVTHYPAWKSGRIKSAIVRKPRADTQNKSAMLEHVARELGLQPANVYYLDDYIRRKSAAFSRQRTNFHGLPPIYVPVAARLRHEQTAETLIDDAIVALDTWRDRPHSPVVLIGGEGGTGKTHVVREISERWNRSDIVRAYSIDSHTFIQKFETRLASNSPIEVYDIYLACGNEGEHVDKESFYDQWVNGNYILIIDGIDEIANRAPGEFSLVAFLEEALKADTEGFGKLLLTAREFLLTDELLAGISVCQLLPFDEKRAHSFFKRTFQRALPDDYSISREKLVERSMRDAVALQQGQRTFVPYVLSLIAESYIESEDGAAVFIEDAGDDKDCGNLTEFVVNRVCQRERLRINDNRIRLEEQRKLFELLSAEGAPGVTEARYQQLIGQVVDGKVSENIERFLKSHLLLARRDIAASAHAMIWFRYDFHAEHFLASLVARYIQTNISSLATNEGKPIPSKPALALINHGGFDDPLITSIADRLREVSYEDLVEGILSTIQADADVDASSKRYLDAALLNIALRKELNEQSAGGSTEEIFTNLAKNLYGRNFLGLSVCRIPRQINRRITINFADASLENAFFEDWHDFFYSAANSQTRFSKTVVNRCGTELRGATALTDAMFDRASCTLDDSAQARLLSARTSAETKEEAMRESLRRFLNAFRSGVGQFREHAGKNWFRGRGFSSMQAANLISAEKFALILLRLELISEEGDRRGGYYLVPSHRYSDVADFVGQARESKVVREAIKQLVAAAK